MRNIPSDLSPVWLCRVCGEAHPSLQLAQACEASTPEPEARVGDFLLFERGYSWFNGDPNWVVQNAGYEFHGMKTHAFWHVVTAIQPVHRIRPFEGNPDLHRVTYHVKTLAMLGQLTGGWTRTKTHYWGKKPTTRCHPSREVIEQSKQLIGHVFDNLL